MQYNMSHFDFVKDYKKEVGTLDVITGDIKTHDCFNHFRCLWGVQLNQISTVGKCVGFNLTRVETWQMCRGQLYFVMV
jgi:hypothetical protein